MIKPNSKLNQTHYNGNIEGKNNAIKIALEYQKYNWDKFCNKIFNFINETAINIKNSETFPRKPFHNLKLYQLF